MTTYKISKAATPAMEAKLAARITKASPAAMAKALVAVETVAYDAAVTSGNIDRSIDAAIKAALAGCDDSEGKRRKLIGETFKLAFAAALLTSCSNNLPFGPRMEHALKLMVPAIFAAIVCSGAVMVGGQVAGPDHQPVCTAQCCAQLDGLAVGSRRQALELVRTLDRGQQRAELIQPRHLQGRRRESRVDAVAGRPCFDLSPPWG